MSRRLRLAAPPTKPPKQDVLIVNTEVATAALRMAGGDSGRILVISTTEVLVFNNRAARDAARQRQATPLSIKMPDTSRKPA